MLPSKTEVAAIESRLPFEFPCFGPSPEAVRAVVSGLLRALPADLRIGCVTDPAGGSAIYASGAAPFPANRVILSAPAWNSDSWRAALADCDLALTEGRPKPGYPGILILPEGTNAPLSEAAPDASLFACVASFANPSSLPNGIPVFSPDRLSALAELIVARARDAAAAVPLYGLVLGGGRSSRMRADKASLVYHGKPQTVHCLDLLGAHCAQSFVSCRADQAGLPGFEGLPQVHDSFLDMGPLGGILSAFKTHRRSAFLVVACDLPFLDAASLAALVAGRDPFKVATAFAGPQDGLPEPLCAIYEPRCYPRALQLMGQGISCPRKVILNSSSRILPAPDLRSLLNANDPETYRDALKAIAT